MKRPLPSFVLLLLVAAPFGVGAQGEGDSVRVQADSAAAEVASEDSAAATPVDPAYIWTTWKDLSRAIKLETLDGPEDIIEKADIIQDRIDDLAAERRQLAETRQEWSDKNTALETQLEVLEDLAKVQLGGDLQLQQRMHRMREGRSVAANKTDVLTRSIRDLDTVAGGLEEMVTDYRKKASELRRLEAER